MPHALLNHLSLSLHRLLLESSGHHKRRLSWLKSSFHRFTSASEFQLTLPSHKVGACGKLQVKIRYLWSTSGAHRVNSHCLGMSLHQGVSKPAAPARKWSAANWRYSGHGHRALRPVWVTAVGQMTYSMYEQAGCYMPSVEKGLKMAAQARRCSKCGHRQAATVYDRDPLLAGA